jgi:hypothetical protein
MIPTVKRMVLFKHGVAYVERGGPAEGSFSLSFAKDEMNDVLKSLSVWVEAGDATPGAIAFEKPESPETALDEKGLNLPNDKSLFGLVTAMRGRRASVRAVAASAGTERTVRGEIVGIDTRPFKNGWRSALVLATGDGALETIELDDVRGVVLEDAVAAADLAFLLDRRRAASSHERRAVHVAIDGKAEDLRVAYIVPAPVWRVSYRVIRDTSGEKEKTVIAAWAIVHNPLDEDAKDVALTLTTGQPISFQIDLYHPKHVERVMVEETSRAISAPPQAFERSYGAPAAPAAMMMAAPGGMGGFQPAPPPAPRMAKGRAEAMMDGAQGAAEGAADLADRGELFEYRVQKPITLKRGGSALVPLLTREVPARRERIWREGRAGSPDLVMAFQNTSGAVLEEGPAVIYDEGIYAGEAMVPYSARGTEVRFAFAKDLSVRCSATTRYDTVTLALRFGRGQAIEDQRQERRIKLRADSDHDGPIDVTFELPKRNELDPRGPKATEETATARRFTVTVPGRSSSELEVIEVSPVSRSVELRGVAARDLDHWRRLNLLTSEVDSVLKEAIAASAQAASHQHRVSELEREKLELMKSLEGLTKQLQVLKEGGAEGELRLRYVNDLRKNQDRVNALDEAMDAARRAALEATQRAEQIVLRVTSP